MRIPRLPRLAAAALFVTTLGGTAASAGHRRQRPRRRGQPARLQPQGAGQPQGPRQHHLLGVGLDGQPDGAAVHHQRVQLLADQGARHTGHPGRLRRHLAEVSRRALQRAAARRGAVGGPAHPGRHRHRLVPARAVLHERGQVLDQRLPAPPPRLLEGERRAVGPSLRRLGADPLLQPERLHEGGPRPGRPPDHVAPDGDRRQGTQGIRQWHGPRPRPLAPRDVAGHGQPALREQQERAQQPGHAGLVQQPGPRCPSSAS